MFGQLHPEQAAERKIKQDVYLAEVMLDRLYRHALREPRYQRISKFPAVERDFSFVFDDAVTWEKIKSAIDELQIGELIALRAGRDLSRRESRQRQVFRPAPHRIPVAGAHITRRRSGEWSAAIIAKLQSLGGTLRAQ